MKQLNILWNNKNKPHELKEMRKAGLFIYGKIKK